MLIAYFMFCYTTCFVETALHKLLELQLEETSRNTASNPKQHNNLPFKAREGGRDRVFEKLCMSAASQRPIPQLVCNIFKRRYYKPFSCLWVIAPSICLLPTQPPTDWLGQNVSYQDNPCHMQWPLLCISSLYRTIRKADWTFARQHLQILV